MGDHQPRRPDIDRRRRFRARRNGNFALVGLIACAAAHANSQNEAATAEIIDTAEAADPVADDLGFVILPIPQSNPTTGTGLTLPVVLFYNPDGEGRPWISGIGGLYTDTDSWAAAAFQKAYLQSDRTRITAGAGYGSFNLDFYGVGASAGDRDTPIPIKQEGSGLLISGSTEVAPKLYLGASYRYISIDTTIKTSQIPFPDVVIPDVQRNSTTSALGLVAEYDMRDSELNPHRGTYASFDGYFAREAVGSDFDYEKASLAYNYYWPVGENATVATRVSACYASDGAPFYDLCLYGSSNDLRGYVVGRYRDGAMFVAQAEYRWRFFKRLGLVVFGGTGAVAEEFGALRSDEFLPAGGVGLRIQASKKYDVNVRIDYAVGEDSDGLYLSIGEAF